MPRHQILERKVSGTRERMIDTALELLAERGYEGMSLQMVADATGVTKAAVYYHFPSKSELLDVLLRRLFADVPTTIPDSSLLRSRRARLSWTVDQILGALTHERRVQAAINGDPAVRKHPTFVALFEGLRARALHFVYGETPTSSELAAFHLATGAVFTLPYLEALTDEELVTAMRPVISRTLGLRSA